MSFVLPKYSFIQLDPLCSPDCRAFYGFAEGDIIQFQVYTVLQDIRIDIETVEGNVVAEDIAVFSQIGDFQIFTITVPGGLSYKEKYKFVLKQIQIVGFCEWDNLCAEDNLCTPDVNIIPLACTQAFKLVPSFEIENYTTIKYYNNESIIGDFDYSGGFQNVIRLPIFLDFPSYRAKREVYRDSQGQTRIISSSLEEFFEMHTDWMPTHFHRCMAIALEHDYFEIVDNEYSGLYISNDDYDIENMKSRNSDRLSKGKVKLQTKVFNVINPKYL